MKASFRMIASVLCLAVLMSFASACSVIKEADEDDMEEIIEIETEKGFKPGEFDDYCTVDSSPYDPSPFYAPVKCTASYDLLESESEKMLYERLSENLYTVNSSTDLDFPSFSDVFRCEQVVMEDVIFTKAQIRTVIQAVYDDHPEIFWITNRYNYMVDEEAGYCAVILYSCYSPKDISRWLERVHEAVDGFISSVPEGLSEYERELYAHDFIIDNCFYIESDANILEFFHSVYGVFVDGKAVCEGYAKAFQMLMNLLGIECVGITGEGINTDEEGNEERDLHMWNAVKIDDEWYLVDCTWDDSEYIAERHIYFNADSESFNVRHVPSLLSSEVNRDAGAEEGPYYYVPFNIFVPECDSDTYSYLIRECPHLTSYKNADNLTDALYEAASEKQDSFLFYVDPEFASVSDALDDLIYEQPQYVFSYIRTANRRLSGYKIEPDTVSFSFDDDMSYIVLYLTYV